MTLFKNPEVTIEENVETFTTGKSARDTLVGEGRKFKDDEALALSKLEGDRFIAQVLREKAGVMSELDRALAENKELREKSVTRLEEIATRLSESKLETPTPVTTPTIREQAPITPEQISDLVQKALAANTAKSREEQNVNEVVTKLKEKYGNNYVSELNQKVSGLGLRREFVDALAAESPKAVFELLGINAPAPQRQPELTPRNRVNTDNFVPTGSRELTMEDYRQMQNSSDPVIRRQYWSAEVQSKIHKQGSEAFNKGDLSFFDTK